MSSVMSPPVRTTGDDATAATGALLMGIISMLGRSRD